MKRPHVASLASGLAIIALGTLLLLRESDAIALGGGWLLACLTACTGVALIASGLGAREG